MPNEQIHDLKIKYFIFLSKLKEEICINRVVGRPEDSPQTLATLWPIMA